jgi:uncharacterized protein YndB with AHSA1/START domain
MQTTTTDRIEKTAVLKAPRSRVWQALTTPDEFGAWFRVKLDAAAFTEGSTVRGRITYPGYEHLTMEIHIETVQPETYFAYRWHPNATDPAKDYSQESATLVEFTLADAPDGTRLTIVESGFDRIRAGRRDEAFRNNDGGWAEQMKNIARHVEGA